MKQDETVDIQNNQTIKVKQDHSLTVTDGNRAIAVSKGDNSLKVDMGNHDVKIAMGNHTTDVKMGNVSLKADLGKIDNEAMQSDRAEGGPELDQDRSDGRHHQRHDDQDRGPDPDAGEGPDDAGERRCNADGQGRHHHDQLTARMSQPLDKLAGRRSRGGDAASGAPARGGGAASQGCTEASEALDRLEAGGFLVEATRLVAHALPKREAVWWACMCVSHTAPADLPAADRAAREAAEDWVRQQTDKARRMAWERAQAGGCRTPEAWAAVAAFWSGESMSPEGQPAVPPAPHLCGQAAAGAVALAAVRGDRYAARRSIAPLS